MGFNFFRHHQYKFLHLGGISFIFILILGVFSGIYYHQRIFFTDPAYVLFNIINTKQFIFSENRIGAFITQLVPLIGTYLKVPLHILEILYSVSFYAFFAFVSAWVTYRNRQPKLALLFGLYLCLTLSSGYFWPTNEVHQGIGWMVLFLGGFLKMIEPNEKRGVIRNIILIILVALAISCHILVIGVLLFLWGFFWISENKNAKRLNSSYWITFSFIIILLCAARLYLSHDSWYDGEKLKNLQNLNWRNFLDSFRNEQAKSFLVLLIKNYWLLIPLALWGNFRLWSKGKYFLSFYSILSAILMFGLICSIFPERISRLNQYYFESEWQSFSMIIVAPFVYYALHNEWKGMQKQLVLVFVIFSIRIFYMYLSLPLFDQRYENLKSLSMMASESSSSKGLLMDDGVHENYLIADWGLPVESILMSEELYDTTLHTYIIMDKYYTSISSKDSFNSCFDIKPILPFFNKQYFDLDTTMIYMPMDSNWIQSANLKKL